ncbi:MAG: anhydro-N-acetylmuramic acid kinase [Saprospiraceae bacterium]
MNVFLQKICTAAQKPARRIIGLMSGTSMDGLDIALCKFEGSGLQTKATLENFVTYPFSEAVKSEIRKVFAQRQVDFQLLTVLNPWIAELHGRLVLQALAEWGIAPGEIDAIASHGQTVFHAPAHQHNMVQYGNATLQIGDGDHLAVTTGITTISDFRQKHIAAGGEGAPLAVYGDFLLFSHPSEHRVLLNIGGIANYTWLPKGKIPRGVFVTDTGPGNTMLDAAVRHFFPERAFDEDGRIAAAGNIHSGLLNALKSHPFFGFPVPKTTGPEVFNLDYLSQALHQAGAEEISPQDQIATLTRFSAETIADSIQNTLPDWLEAEFYVSGGGAHNPVLTKHLSDLLPGIDLLPFESLGISGDAKEAILFAVLANETIAGGNIRFEGIPSVSMGKISFPG